MTLPRFITMPGPVPDARVASILAHGLPFSLDLKSGLSLLDAVTQAFAKAGFSSGVLDVTDVGLARMAYVMPALSDTAQHAAFYSSTHRPQGAITLLSGRMTFGMREGAPFFHCHALWQEEDGHVHGGHLLPEDCVIGTKSRVEALGLADAHFIASPDQETNFTLFSPEPAPQSRHVGLFPALAVRLRPNQDFHAAIESLCLAQGWMQARILGGVGSLIGARFADGRIIENFATEVFIRSGTIAQDASGKPMLDCEIGLVDFTGQTAHGRLARGKNNVLMTFELVIVPI